MRRLAPILILTSALSGCAGVSERGATVLSSTIVAQASEPAPVRTAVLDWKGGLIQAEDPSNSEYFAETSKFPEMPLKPLAEGPLTGSVYVLDPGHGGKDPGCYWIENFGGRNVAFWESAYNYAMMYPLAQKLREKGAIVYLTAHSAVAEEAWKKQTSANEPLPVPRDATLAWNGASVTPERSEWWQRVHMANDVYKRFKKTHKVVCLSIHVDSMPGEGWQGSHVLVRDKANPPPVGRALAQQIKKAGIAKNRFGEPKRLLDRTRSLFLFKKSINPNTILWETGLPQDPDDSARIRDRESREELLEVAVRAAEEFSQD